MEHTEKEELNISDSNIKTIRMEDTICAISTPGGVGGIAVIRVSGQSAIEITDRIWKGKPLADSPSHKAHLGEIGDWTRNEAVDQCVATVFRAPKSFTGEDTVEISVHGSRWIQREALALLLKAGCRMAEAGEFTRRAVMNGRMDLAQAEGVADVIASTSRAAHRIAMSQMKGSISRKLTELRGQLLELSVLLELELDFSEEDVEFADRSRLLATALSIKGELQHLYGSFRKGSAIKEGIPVAIVGATNAGKSSLLNALLDYDRAIVSDIHGTTRDTIEETMEIGDYMFRFIDTAGLRDTADPIEQIGIQRSHKAIEQARIIIALIDISSLNIEGLSAESIIESLPEEIRKETSDESSVIIAFNKCDLVDTDTMRRLESLSNQLLSHSRCISNVLSISVENGTGINRIRETLTEIASENCDDAHDSIIITNLRQAEALRQSIASITPLIQGLESGLETDLVAQHLRETLSNLASITGEIPSTEVLNTIFSNFCIGK